MEVAAAIDAMLALAAAPARQERILAMRAAFEARTGSFSARDSFFEDRSAAFWDDALTRGAFGRELAGELSEEARALVEPFARAHRGLFLVEPDGGAFSLVDEWSGAEFVAEPSTPGLRDALERAASLVDARVVGAALGGTTQTKTVVGAALGGTTQTKTVVGAGRIVVLPGAVFHHADALAPMRAVLPAARAREMPTHDALDALLRMDHAFRTLSRVKPAFAYRKEAL